MCRQVLEKISNFTKLRPMRIDLFYADRRMDGRTDETKLLGVFRNYFKKSSGRESVYASDTHKNLLSWAVRWPLQWQAVALTTNAWVERERRRGRHTHIACWGALRACRVPNEDLQPRQRVSACRSITSWRHSERRYGAPWRIHVCSFCGNVSSVTANL
jgi:hypothetical protein